MEMLDEFQELLRQRVNGKFRISREIRSKKFEEILQNFTKCVLDDFIVNEEIPVDAKRYFIAIASANAHQGGLEIKLESSYSTDKSDEKNLIGYKSYILTESPCSANHGNIAHDRDPILEHQTLLNTKFVFKQDNSETEYFISFVELFGNGIFEVPLEET